MKKHLSYLSIVAATALSTAVLFSSCENTDYPDALPATSPSTNLARYLFVNASPDAPALTFLIENTVAGQSLASGQAATSYVSSQVGAVQLDAQATTGAIGGVLSTSAVIFRASSTNQTNFLGVAGASYTVFVTDSINRPRPTVTNGTNPGGPQIVVVTDPLTQTLAANAGGVRFFHLAPDVGVVSLRLLPTAPASVSAGFGNRTFRTVAVNAFTSVPAATYTAQVFSGTAVPPLSSTTAPVLSLTGVTVEATKLYTIYAQGLARRRTLSVGRIQHN